MKKKIYVPDASIFAKLFHPEHDSEQAKQFFKTCAKENIKLAAPDIFRYELVVSEKFNFRFSLFQGKTPIRSTGKAEKIGLKKIWRKKSRTAFKIL